MTIKDVVRGVEEIEIQAMTTVRAEGYNSLAHSEVVVDREKLLEICKTQNCDYYELSEAIATAIESGSIISLKKEVRGEKVGNI